MKARTLWALLAVMAVAATVAIIACKPPIAGFSKSATTGSLRISLSNKINARTLLPSVSMNVGSYSITGTGPDSATFTLTSSGDPVNKDRLAFGTWTVTVEAYNDETPAVLIGSGTATADVHSGEATALTITVVPLPGPGSLSLDVSWNAADIEAASIEASLIPTIGTTRTLDFTLSGGSASFSATDVAAGYHTLILQLLDSGTVAAGLVEMVRIVTDATTSGTVAFTQVNKPGGTIEVNIDPELADPIAVTMSGVPSTIGEGQPMTVSASVPAGTPNVSYVWYVNGASVGTGSPASLVSPLVAGHYRLDVTAITADGTRAGSATASFKVTAGTASTSTAQWARTVTVGTNISQFNGVTVDVAGNVYAAGFQVGSRTFTYGTGSSATGSSSTYNVVLAKYDASGAAQWARTVSSGLSSSVFSAVAVDAAGNVYAAGYQTGYGTIYYSSEVSVPDFSTNANLVLVKYDESGAAQWARTVQGGTFDSQFNGVAVDAAGNIYATGYQAGTGTYAYGTGVSATGSSANANVVLVKYDASGAVQWARTVSAGLSSSVFSAVAVDAAGNVYAAGYQQGTGTYTYGAGVSAVGSSSGDNVVLVKYDASGAAQWARTVSTGTNDSLFYGVAVDAPGNVYAAGHQYGTGTYTYGTGVSANGSSASYNVVLVKYDASGTARWVQTVTTGTDTSGFVGVSVDESGNVYACGIQDGTEVYTYGSGVSAAGSYSAGSNVILVKYGP